MRTELDPGCKTVLRELYGTAARVESLDAAAKLLRIRAMALEDGVPDPRDAVLPEQLSAASEIFSALAGDDSKGEKDSLGAAARLEQVEDPGERELIRAILALRDSNTESGRARAMEILNNGLEHSLGDLRLRLLAEVLFRADRTGGAG